MHAEPYEPKHAKAISSDPDSDSAGRSQIHAAYSLRLHMADGIHAVQYGAQIGWPWMNPEATRIEIPAAGQVKSDGVWKSGEWLVVIAGKRLEMVFDQIAEARRLSVKVTEGKVPEPKPVIETISVLPMEEE